MTERGELDARSLPLSVWWREEAMRRDMASTASKIYIYMCRWTEDQTQICLGVDQGVMLWLHDKFGFLANCAPNHILLMSLGLYTRSYYEPCYYMPFEG